MIARRSPYLLLLALLAVGCARSHGTGSEPDPEPLPPTDGGVPAPEPSDASVPEPEPDPVCPGTPLNRLGLRGPVSGEPVTATVVGVRTTEELAEAQLELSDGTMLGFRAPAEHFETLVDGTEVQAAIDWDGGARASRLTFPGGEIVAFESSSLPEPDGLKVGELSLGPGTELCSDLVPECGTERTFALRVTQPGADGFRELEPGESLSLPTPVPEGSSYLVTHGDAIDYGCERCECFVGAHFAAVVTERALLGGP